MLQLPNWSYTHLIGWSPLISQLIANLNAATGAYAFRMVELKGRYGTLRIDIEPVDDTPIKIVAAVEKLIAAAEKQSEHTCIDCGAPAMLHEWNTDWILPCCLEHARERAKHVTAIYTGPGWWLTPDFKIVDDVGALLTEAQTKALDLAAARQERRMGQVVVIDLQAADWWAARWMARPVLLDVAVQKRD